MSRAVSRYVFRATLGLPRHERLELAAELRTHLLDRTRQLQAEGFSREEAEHLAVQGMGNVSVTNRQLLGHVLTHPLGWAVLAALLLCGGSWWVWRYVPLPAYRQTSVQWSQTVEAADLARLYEVNAPRGEMLTADLRVPARAQWFYLVVISQREEGMFRLWRYDLRGRTASGEATVSPNVAKKARLLLTAQAWNTAPYCTSDGQVALLADLRWTPQNGAALEGGMMAYSGEKRAYGIPSGVMCQNLHLPMSGTEIDGGTMQAWQQRHLQGARPAMNSWTVMAFYSVNYTPTGKATFQSTEPTHKHDFLVAVMPADQLMDADATIHGGRDQGRGYSLQTRTQNWRQNFPTLPRPTGLSR
ncbi:permease prefix domain 1-containing protein [Deinococcus arcticus]|uniref:permease prefix domain 1-containing protein n=1 Tax=Deinococcus arcticus TaxID=2136176 RepID=UPI0018EC54C5|nr:permease prefix domain 1-containing protein [Deinococcus arcticus]